MLRCMVVKNTGKVSKDGDFNEIIICYDVNRWIIFIFYRIDTFKGFAVNINFSFFVEGGE